MRTGAPPPLALSRRLRVHGCGALLLSRRAHAYVPWPCAVCRVRAAATCTSTRRSLRPSSRSRSGTGRARKRASSCKRPPRSRLAAAARAAAAAASRWRRQQWQRGASATAQPFAACSAGLFGQSVSTAFYYRQIPSSVCIVSACLSPLSRDRGSVARVARCRAPVRSCVDVGRSWPIRDLHHRCMCGVRDVERSSCYDRMMRNFTETLT